MLHFLLLTILAVSVSILPQADAYTIIHARAVPGGLRAARDAARLTISTRPTADVHVVVAPGSHSLTSPLNLGEADSGEAGRFKVVWRGAAPPSPSSVLDGGVSVPGPWTPWPGSVAGSAVKLWSAPLPGALRGKPVRQLYVNHARYTRTRSPTSGAAIRVAGGQGFQLNTTEPLSWPSAAAVEIVSDHTWVQHRCPVVSISPLPKPPPPTPPPVPPPAATCAWGSKLSGRSPGSSLKKLSASSYEECQRACCGALPRCQAIIFNSAYCYLLGRKVEGNYIKTPAGGSFVADLNCTNPTGATATCPAFPPPPTWRTQLNVSAACWEKATASGALQLNAKTLSYFENTGVFTQEGQFFIDEVAGRVLVSAASAPAAADAVSVGVTQTLLNVSGAHDIEWHNLSFVGSGWGDPSTIGMVERYGGTLFSLKQDRRNSSISDGSSKSGGLISSPAAFMVANSSRVQVIGCSFSRLGAWGIRLYNGTQAARIARSIFHDLSGGGICLGNVDDSAESEPSRQMASISVDDNCITDVGREYKGAPGIHSYCMRESSVSHNLVRGVPYSGLSFNWPLPQGPTFGPPHGDGGGNTGYSRNNVVEGNDVSEYMSYMLDGGGIHTIGRSANTSISRNFFHDVASGTSSCGAAGTALCHSIKSQSTIYIDNWSAGYRIEENVVVDTAATIQGWIFFQFFAQQAGSGGAAAHDNTARDNTICNAGPVPPRRDPWDEPIGANVTGTVNVSDCQTLPAAAAAVVRAAGPRSGSSFERRVKST